MRLIASTIYFLTSILFLDLLIKIRYTIGIIALRWLQSWRSMALEWPIHVISEVGTLSLRKVRTSTIPLKEKFNFCTETSSNLDLINSFATTTV